MQQVIFNSGGNVGYLNGSVFRIGGAMGATKGGTSAPGKGGGADLTTAVAKGESGDVALWGPNNDFPQQVLAEISKSSIIPPVLDWKTRAIYGKGIVYGKVTGYDDKGNEIFKREKNDEIKAFFRRSNIPRFGFEGIQNLVNFANGWPELVLSKDRSEITSLATLDTTFCRYSVQKPGEAVPALLHHSANWPEAKPGDGFTTSIPVLDPYFDVAESLRADTRGFKYVYPLSLPSPGQALYQLIPWNSIRKSGWLDVAQTIPEFKKALFKNQLSLKYIIEAHEGYWKWKYPDWDTKTTEDRRQIIGDELADFEKTMAGAEGAGKSILTITFTDPQNPGQLIQAFKVTAIDDKIKSGIYIEDSQEAASHIYTALQVDPTLSGISPGKGMGAGSGSDKRVAFNAFIATHYYLQQLILEPLNLVRDYNGWDPDIEFRFLNTEINTLDQAAESSSKF
ncbi:hypothetical protein [Hymenobacter chitinivorans]|uniref:Uncharacterized protein n=1 Tax=Hymenobacter chitinivorans DSM 11115 TaxID=1121954 RepID=A0A2M9BNC0_9BACT|nr:hypothetical protein [Hymenobacter chitinivorans]PJJ59439.1 hypothetical protein CLV45_0856 [Hymenobacter chitinivorans DSM 11115]